MWSDEVSCMTMAAGLSMIQFPRSFSVLLPRSYQHVLNVMVHACRENFPDFATDNLIQGRGCSALAESLNYNRDLSIVNTGGPR